MNEKYQRTRGIEIFVTVSVLSGVNIAALNHPKYLSVVQANHLTRELLYAPTKLAVLKRATFMGLVVSYPFLLIDYFKYHEKNNQ